MKTEDQVCSFDQAALIYSYGIRFDTVFYWYQNKETGENIVCHADKYIAGYNWVKLFPAYNVAELGKVMNYFFLCRELNGWSLQSLNDHCGKVLQFFDISTEAKARGAAFIWLIDKEYLTKSNITL